MINLPQNIDVNPQGVNGQLIAAPLVVRFGGYSAAGVKARNDDAFAAKLPASKAARQMKGAVACIADGISVSDRSHLASQLSVTQFIDDYFSTPDSWSVEECASKVLRALNDWLASQSRHNQTSAMVTTFSAAIMKSKSLHLFHIGDSRIYRLRGGQLTQVTRDHCMNFTRNDAVLTAALGMDSRLAVDYSRMDIDVGDILLLTTDGVTGSLSLKQMTKHLMSLGKDSSALDFTAQTICDAALQAGSTDNVTCGIAYIDSLPLEDINEAHARVQTQKIPPVMKPGNKIDGLEIISVIKSGTRSHIYKVRDIKTGTPYILKVPSANFTDDATYLNGFIREQWIGRRMTHPGLMKVFPSPDNSPFLYLLCEPVDGMTLREWALENENPSVAQVRAIIKDIITPLRALHRMGMIHRDLKPENIMITHSGDIKIIDYGTVQVAGMDDINTPIVEDMAVGSVNYSAPETVLGKPSTAQSDTFSLGVIAYELLAGATPFADKSKVYRRPVSLSDWTYKPLQNRRPQIPTWVDYALQTACAPNPARRYSVMSEFFQDLTTPNPKARQKENASALLERNPLAFWKGLAGLLGLSTLILIGLLAQALN